MESRWFGQVLGTCSKLWNARAECGLKSYEKLTARIGGS